MMMIRAFASRVRISARTSSPLASGRFMSRRMTSGRKAEAAVRPSEPLAALRTSYPFSSRSRAKMSRMFFSSSMMRIRNFMVRFPGPQARGRLTRIAVPCPGLLRASISPWWALTML